MSGGVVVVVVRLTRRRSLGAPLILQPDESFSIVVGGNTEKGEGGLYLKYRSAASGLDLSNQHERFLIPLLLDLNGEKLVGVYTQHGWGERLSNEEQLKWERERETHYRVESTQQRAWR